MNELDRVLIKRTDKSTEVDGRSWTPRLGKPPRQNGYLENKEFLKHLKGVLAVGWVRSESEALAKKLLKSLLRAP